MFFLVPVFGRKTFLNFESNAFNTARSAGTAALCHRQKLNFDEIDTAHKRRTAHFSEQSFFCIILFVFHSAFATTPGANFYTVCW
jgi:alpha-D-ribose 1-methylphosphonate 5-phosphate C-P lyase